MKMKALNLRFKAFKIYFLKRKSKIIKNIVKTEILRYTRLVILYLKFGNNIFI